MELSAPAHPKTVGLGRQIEEGETAMQNKQLVSAKKSFLFL
jgi:hypothetical protein